MISLTAIFTAAQRVNKWQLVHGEERQSECLRKLREAAKLIEDTCIVTPPPTIISPEATCLLAGDCCHSLHPLLGQGLNLGLEDAATLGHLLSHVQSPIQLPKAVLLYDRLRTDRAKKLDNETCVKLEKLRWFDDGLERCLNKDTQTVYEW